MRSYRSKSYTNSDLFIDFPYTKSVLFSVFHRLLSVSSGDQIAFKQKLISFLQPKNPLFETLTRGESQNTSCKTAKISGQ
jgi:hypothetical protein